MVGILSHGGVVGILSMLAPAKSKLRLTRLLRAHSLLSLLSAAAGVVGSVAVCQVVAAAAVCWPLLVWLALKRYANSWLRRLLADGAVGRFLAAAVGSVAVCPAVAAKSMAGSVAVCIFHAQSVLLLLALLRSAQLFQLLSAVCIFHAQSVLLLLALLLSAQSLLLLMLAAAGWLAVWLAVGSVGVCKLVAAKSMPLLLRAPLTSGCAAAGWLAVWLAFGSGAFFIKCGGGGVGGNGGWAFLALAVGNRTGGGVVRWAPAAVSVAACPIVAVAASAAACPVVAVTVSVAVCPLVAVAAVGRCWVVGCLAGGGASGLCTARNA